MIRKILVGCVTFIFFFIGNSQEQYDYVGGIVLNDSISITYRLSITEKGGNITGFSITDLGGIYETKSTIFGEYNEKEKELSFRETQTIYTKTPLEPDYEFCYVNTTLKNFSFDKTKKVSTRFIGLFADNTQCINGDLFLSPLEKVEDNMERVSKKINKMKRVPDSIKQNFKPLKVMDSLKMNILRKNQTLSVFSKSQKIKLTIYDGGKEDGDAIRISVNGNVLRKSIQATRNKQEIFIELKQPKTTIAITAINEGMITPNTVVVELDDNQNNIKALSNLKKGEVTKMDILKLER